MTVSGWFTDPGGKVSTFRWWNGEAWTRWLSADPHAADPGPEPQPPGLTGAPAAENATSTEPLDLAALPPPNPADRVVKLPAAVAIVATVVLLTLIAVGAIVSLTADRPLTGPPVAPPGPTQAPPTIAYDPATRKVSFEEMRFIAPGQPFTCDPEPGKLLGIFTSVFSCSARVHGNYDKKGANWVTVVAMGQLDDKLETGGDLPTIASRTFTELLTPAYGMVKATVKKQKIQWLKGIAPDGHAVLLSADVHVSTPGLATQYDRVVLVVVKLQSGQHLAWYAMRANDSKADVRKALQASADTLTAR